MASSSHPEAHLSIAGYLPDRLIPEATALLHERRGEVNEIRLRTGRPAVAMLTQGFRYLGGGQALTPEEIQNSFEKICGYSVYSHQSELSQGFVTLPGGHRVGIAGSACVDKSGNRTIKYITSLNLRVAIQHIGCSDGLFERVFADGIHGTLIAGPPCSGKTSLLKDFALKLSSAPYYKKTVLVDERDELAAMCRGTPCHALGDFCDVLSGYPKGEGILNAVRTLSPDVVVCDEIGDRGDAEAVCDAVNAGVVMIVSAHACNADELYRREPVKKLLQSGAFDSVVLLKGGSVRCEAKEVLPVAEVLGHGL